MAVHYIFRAYDVRLAITLPGSEWQADVLKFLAWTTSTLEQVASIPLEMEDGFDVQPTPDDPTLFQVHLNGVALHPGVTREILPQRLEIEIIVFLANTSQRYHFIHAGVVRWHGKLIMIPGSGRAGKSTLVQALVGEGAEYFSDEFAVLDDEARIWPLARQLYQRDGPYGPKTRVSLGHATPVVDDTFTPPTVDIVLLARWEPNSPWSISPLTPSETVIALVPHVASMQAKPRSTLQVLTALGENAAAFRCERPDLESALSWLSAYCQSDLRRSAPPESTP